MFPLWLVHYWFIMSNLKSKLSNFKAKCKINKRKNIYYEYESLTVFQIAMQRPTLIITVGDKTSNSYMHQYICTNATISFSINLT